MKDCMEDAIEKCRQLLLQRVENECHNKDFSYNTSIFKNKMDINVPMRSSSVFGGASGSIASAPNHRSLNALIPNS